MTSIEKLVCAAIVLLLVVGIVGAAKNSSEFKRVCAESGGTTVWDGRQYQCIKGGKAEGGA